MSLDDIRKSDKDFLIPADIAPVLGCDKYTICVMAREGTLPFRYFRAGNRTRIPRLAFIAWMEGRDENKNAAPLA